MTATQAIALIAAAAGVLAFFANISTNELAAWWALGYAAWAFVAFVQERGASARLRRER